MHPPLKVFFILLMCSINIGLCFVNLADVECGLDTARKGRIVGGEDSLPAEFPWTVSLWRLGVHQCGATVLSDRWLLTAGHCVCSVLDEFYKAAQLSAVVGYTDLSLKQENEGIATILPHPGYRCGKKQNDVALLKTIRRLKWTDELRPACLPQPKSSDFSGITATVTGWGFTQEDRDKGERPTILQKTSVVVVNNDQCNTWYESEGGKIKITVNQMCAGYEDGGRDSCWADSGGPLLVQGEKSRTIVIGVVSTGNGCARPRKPGIYTRISKYTDWIVETVKTNQLTRGLSWYRTG